MTSSLNYIILLFENKNHYYFDKGVKNVRMLKHSRRREFIKHYLDTHRTHPTAEMVYLDMKEQFPNISLGTVYRNLNCLADMGEILRISSKNGPDRYDGKIEPHYHFICTECGDVLDLDLAPQTNLNKMAGEHFQGSIINHETHFFGLCPECYQNKKF